MKLTVTIDTDLHKVMPVALSDVMMHAMQSINNSLENKEYAAMYDEMLLSLPDTLPGVVKHSGEPCAWAYSSERGVDITRMKWSDDMKAGCLPSMTETPLYAAAPAPANSVAIVQAALEAAAKLIENSASCRRPASYAEDIRAINPQTILDAVSGE